MADIELIIKISEEEYRWIKKSDDSIFADIAEKECMLHAIKNGTPLPEKHGRLIILSEDAVKREQTSLRFSCQNWISEVGLSNATVAIIEADKTESEEDKV